MDFCVNERQETYANCYVVFLDVLGFKSIVEQIDEDSSRLCAISALMRLGQIGSGKRTSDGFCPVQTRAFSDCLVIFTPCEGERETSHSNPLPHLLLVLRYLHDRALDAGVLLRGGLVVGKMYWHADWSQQDSQRPANDPSGGVDAPLDDSRTLPLTFGRGLNNAYALEQTAKAPRILLTDDVVGRIRAHQGDPYPFGDTASKLDTFVRTDTDGNSHLDLLNSKVLRTAEDELVRKGGGFTIQIKEGGLTSCGEVRSRARALVDEAIGRRDCKPSVRCKYEWLGSYLDASETSDVQ